MSSHTTDFPESDSPNAVNRADSLIVVKGAAGSRTTENQRISDVVPKATNVLVDAETDDTAFTTTAKVFRAIDRKVKTATTLTRGIVLLARNEDVDSSETDLTRIPTVSAAIRLVRRLIAPLRQVPSTPGTDSGTGRVLTVTGTGDKSYAWRDPAGLSAALRARLLPDFPAAGSRNGKVPKFNGDVLQWLEDAAAAGGNIADNSLTPAKAQADTAARKKAWRDRLASSSIGLVANALPAVASHNTGDTLIIGRGGATVVPFREIDEPATEITDTVAGDVVMLLAAGWTRVGNLFSGGIAAAAAQTAAAAAQLATDTVIGLGPAFVLGETGPKNLAVNIRHPINAYPTATLMSVSPAGQPAVLVGYDRTQLHQDTLAEVSAASLQNIWDQEDAIDDGQGGTTRVKRYPVGSYVPVEVRLLTGRGGDTVFIRVVDVLVVARIPVRFDVAVGASPAVLPVGTEEIYGYTTQGGRRYPFVFPLRTLNSAEADHAIDAQATDQGMNTSKSSALRGFYTPATRTLTYAKAPNNSANLNLIRARGFA